MNQRKITIINGPNLNLTGKREPDKYGRLSFEEWLPEIKLQYPCFDIEYFQSNIEGEIINKLQQVGFSAHGIILNPGGYTHTSVSIADTVAALTTPVVEVHLSQILAREPFRQASIVSAQCKGIIAGFGLDSYRLALEFFMKML